MKKIVIFLCLLISFFTNTVFAKNTPSEKVYMIIEITIKDNETYSQYVKKVPSIIKKYGGKYLVRGGEVTSITGNWSPERIIVIEFVNMQELRECFQSTEYAQIAPLRKNSTISKAIVVNGIRLTE